MSAAPDAPSALATGLRRPATGAVLGTVLAALGAWLLWFGAHEANTVSWECAAGTCASDDVASAAPVLGLLLLAGAFAPLVRATRQATPGLLLAVASGAWLAGLHAAVRDHLASAQEIARPSLVLGVVLALGLVGAVVGAVRSLRAGARAPLPVDEQAAPPTPPATLADAGVVADLERLDALHRAGALTDAEFTAAKSRLLAATD